MKDLREHLAELAGSSAYEQQIAAIETRERRHKPPGKHAPEIPARSIPVAPLSRKALALLRYLSSFAYIDQEEDELRRFALELLSATPNISFAPLNGGKQEIASLCTKLNVPVEESARLVDYVSAIENASSDVISARLLDHALASLSYKSDALRTIAGADDLEKSSCVISIHDLARAVVQRTPHPSLFETLPAQALVDLTVQFIARYGRSVAGGRHHMFKRETLIDWLAHDQEGLVEWLGRIGQRELAALRWAAIRDNATWRRTSACARRTR